MNKLLNILNKNHSLVFATGVLFFFLGFEFVVGWPGWVLAGLAVVGLLYPPVLLLVRPAEQKGVRSNYLTGYAIGLFSFLLQFLQRDSLLGDPALLGNSANQFWLDLIRLAAVFGILAAILFISFVELSWRSLNAQAELDVKRVNRSRQSAVQILLIIPLLAGINYIVKEKNYNFDLTRGNVYSLSDISRKVVRGLKRKTEIYAWYPVQGLTITSAYNRKVPENTNAISKEVEIMLEQIRSLNDKYIDLKFMDYRADADIAESMNVSGHGVVVFRAANPDRDAEDAFLKERVTIRTLKGLKTMEEKFIRAILSVNAPKRTVCQSLAEGGRDLSRVSNPASTLTPEGYQGLKNELRNGNFHLKKWSFENGFPNQVAPECDILLYFAPRQEPGAESVEAVRQYLTGGGAVLLVLDGGPKHPRFQELLNDFQVRSEAGPLRTFVRNPKYKQWNPRLIWDTQLDEKHPVAQSLKEQGFGEVLFRSPGFFKIDRQLPKKMGSLKITQVVRTGLRNYVDKNGNQKQEKEELARNHSLVMALEKIPPKNNKSKKKAAGKNKQAPADAADQAKTEDQSQGADGDAMKLALVADSTVFSDTAMRNFAANRVLAGAVFRWLAQGETLLGIRPKMGTVTPVVLTSSRKNLIYFVGLAVLPLTVLGGGLLFVRLRRRRRTGE